MTTPLARFFFLQPSPVISKHLLPLQTPLCYCRGLVDIPWCKHQHGDLHSRTYTNTHTRLSFSTQNWPTQLKLRDEGRHHFPKTRCQSQIPEADLELSRTLPISKWSPTQSFAHFVTFSTVHFCLTKLIKKSNDDEEIKQSTRYARTPFVAKTLTEQKFRSVWHIDPN